MCCNETAEYSVCDGWPNGDVDGRKLRRLARSSRRGTLELGTEDTQEQFMHLQTYFKQYKPLVPDLGVNYRNWVIRSFDLGNGLYFSTSVLTTTYFIEHKLAPEKQAERSHELTKTVALTSITIVCH